MMQNVLAAQYQFDQPIVEKNSNGAVNAFHVDNTAYDIKAVPMAKL